MPLPHSTTTTLLLPWNSPPCSACKQPIEKIEDAYACWFTTSEGPKRPLVIHHGTLCEGMRRLKQQPGLMALPVTACRATPMVVVVEAVRSVDDSDAWDAWVSVVLGLAYRVDLLDSGAFLAELVE